MLNSVFCARPQILSGSHSLFPTLVWNHTWTIQNSFPLSSSQTDDTLRVTILLRLYTLAPLLRITNMKSSRRLNTLHWPNKGGRAFPLEEGDALFKAVNGVDEKNEVSGGGGVEFVDSSPLQQLARSPETW